MNLIISIPEDVECLLKSGQEVNFNTPFLENKIITEISIPVSQRLKIAPDKIFNYLKKFVGDTFEKNEVIAEKKSLIKNNKVITEFKGKIKEINHTNGEIVVTTLTAHEGNIKASFIGEVIEIDKKQLKVKVKEGHEFSIKSCTNDFGGEAFYLPDIDKPIVEQQMDNKILITEEVSSYLESKTEALGAKGFVTLKNFTSESNLNKTQLKNTEDLKKIFHLNLPYCLITKEYSKIYFYR